jgi:hypothetical protein
VCNSGMFDELSPVEKLFVILCFEHSEKLEDVAEGIERIDHLLKSIPQTQSSRLRNQPSTFRKHYELLALYGRYPYRNLALGRPCTPLEMEFLSHKSSIPTFARRTMRRTQPDAKQGNTRADIARAGGISVSDYGPERVAPSMQQHNGKVLLIHGFRGSGRAFATKISKIKQGLSSLGYSLYYAQAPLAYKFEPGSQAEAEALEKFGGELPDLSHQRVWWKAEEVPLGAENEATTVVVDNDEHENKVESAAEQEGDGEEAMTREKLLMKKMKYVGIEQSLAYLEGEIETKGPFVGVLGFAQGATMAALLVNRLKQKTVSSLSKGGDTYGGLKFAVFISGYCPRDDGYRYDFTEFASQSQISSFHTWGK